MRTLRLLGTSTSHFARKVRIVLHELGIPFDFELVRTILGTDVAAYGQNPLLRIPTLIDGDLWIIESDNIARYIVTTRAPSDPMNVLAPSTADLNQLAVLNGIMAHEVTLLLAVESGISDITANSYFQKLRQAMTSGLSWLDRELDTERDSFDYLDVTTVCMWEHLNHYRTVSGLEAYGRIAKRVARFSERESVVRTLSPTFTERRKARLDEARARGAAGPYTTP